MDLNHPLVHSGALTQFKLAHPTTLVNAFRQTRSFEPVTFKAEPIAAWLNGSALVSRGCTWSLYTKETKKTKNLVLGPGPGGIGPNPGRAGVLRGGPVQASGQFWNHSTNSGIPWSILIPGL